MVDGNTIVLKDCLEGMRELMEDDSVDLTVTSPPYDGLRQYGDNRTADTWCSEVWEPIIAEICRVTKEGGVAVWVVGDATENGSESGTSFRQALHFMECGMNLHDTMIWKKKNPMPQVKTKRYTQCFEYMFVFSKGVPKTFNPLKQRCKFGGKVYSSTCKNMGGEDGRTKKEFVLNSERVKDNVWEIAVSQNKTNHPAVFPIAIPTDHIVTWTSEGDLVFDPFMGSGTTAIAAINTNRRYFGFEKNAEYHKECMELVRRASVQPFLI